MTAPQPTILQRIGTSKPAKGEAARIERLGQMDDRRKMYKGAQDKQALLALAEEYRHLGRPCLTLASQIEAEANGIKDGEK